MEVLGIGSALTLTSAVPMLIFCLLYTPCVAAIAAVKREISTRSALLLVLCQCSIAWVCALAARWLTILFI
jgi:ferrous iron transport protein B